MVWRSMVMHPFQIEYTHEQNEHTERERKRVKKNCLNWKDECDAHFIGNYGNFNTD